MHTRRDGRLLTHIQCERAHDRGMMALERFGSVRRCGVVSDVAAALADQLEDGFSVAFLFLRYAYAYRALAWCALLSVSSMHQLIMMMHGEW